MYCCFFLFFILQSYLYLLQKALEENRWRELELTQERAAKLMDGSLGKSKSASRLASNLVMT